MPAKIHLGGRGILHDTRYLIGKVWPLTVQLLKLSNYEVWLLLGWVTIWDTLLLLRCDWHLLCSAMAYVIWVYKRFPVCSLTCKKAGVCAVMPMWLVHIKEHVWTVRTSPTTMSECVNEYSIKRLNKKEVLPHMRWQTCMLPRELIWEGWLPL